MLRSLEGQRDPIAMQKAMTYLQVGLGGGYQNHRPLKRSAMRNPEYLDSQSRITWTVKRQHLDTSSSFY